MRKKDIKKAVAAFDKARNELMAFVAAVEGASIGGQGVSWAYEYAIIRLYREFETLMLECLVTALNNDSSVLSDRTGIKFPDHLSAGACEYIVVGDGYFDFRGRDGLIKTLKRFLDADHFVVGVVSEAKYKDSLEKLAALRNFAAHDSAKSKKSALKAIDQERVGSAGSWLKRQERLKKICKKLGDLAADIKAQA